MWEDPIVAEIHKIREKMAAKFNYDIGAMIDDARKREKTSGHPIVSPPRRGKSKRGTRGSPRRRSARRPSR